MTLATSAPRCPGDNCPSASNCRRYTERYAGHVLAAFYARREAGADACESIIPVARLSTFEASNAGT